MKSRFPAALLLAALLVTPNTGLLADGIVQQLPADGSWIKYAVTGKTLLSTELVTSTTGTITVRSVGGEQVDMVDCRWLEIETELDSRAERGIRSKLKEVVKLLVPVKHLAAGENPLEHVVKAWKKRTDGSVVELNLKEKNSKDVWNLEMLLNGGFEKAEPIAGVLVTVPAGKFSCTHLTGKGSTEEDEATIETETWLNPDVSFGVAAYRMRKLRKSGVERWLELKYSEFGGDAKSAIAK